MTYEERIKHTYPEGTIIELIEKEGRPDLHVGLKGVVKYVDDEAKIFVEWENGMTFPLTTDDDCFRKIKTEPTISVLYVEPDKYPKVIEIEDTLEAMQELCGGYIEEYMPYDDLVAIVCNAEGKMNGMPLNRAVYAEPELIEMPYNKLKDALREAEKGGKEHLKAHIVFTKDSFENAYNQKDRTYVISSDNKAFIEGMGGYSIFGSCLNGKDPNVRLDLYMSDECGGKDGWKIEKCYLEKDNKQMLDIIAGPFFMAHIPVGSDKFHSMPEHLAEKYRLKFRFPERFYKDGNEIKAIPFKPIRKDLDR